MREALTVSNTRPAIVDDVIGARAAMRAGGKAALGRAASAHGEEISAPPRVFEEGVWRYVTDSSRSATVVGYFGDDTCVIVPAQLGGHGVAHIGSSAFSHCRTVRKVVLPQGLRTIGAHAFEGCLSLRDIALPDSLESIGDEAFSLCQALGALHVPARVSRLGANINGAQNAMRGIQHPRIEISAENDCIIVGAVGEIYQREEDGISLVDASQVEAETLVVEEGCVRVASRACAANSAIAHVVLPEGLKSLGAAAFRGCTKLSRIEFPSTLAEICKGALSCTALEELDLPAACTRLEQKALCLGPLPAHGKFAAYASHLRTVRVAGGNPVLRADGALLSAYDDKSMRREAVLCARTAQTLDISRDIAYVAGGALCGVSHVGTLRFHERLRWQEGELLLPHARCEKVVVELDCPGERTAELELDMPGDTLTRALFEDQLKSGKIDVVSFARAYDEMLPRVKDEYLRAKLMLARIADPCLLERAAAKRFADELAPLTDALCVDFGRKGNWAGIEQLADARLIDERNVSRAADLLAYHADALAVGYVLDMKQRRFGKVAFDYDL